MLRKPGEGEPWLTPFGDTVTWLIGEEETEGRYALMERLAPAGAKSAPHSHKRSEAFFVTAGEFDLTVGEQTFRAGAGAMIYAPEGELHGWATVGEQPGRMLILFSPSPPRAYYRDLDALVRSSGDSPPDMRAVIELSKQHNVL